MHTIYRRQKCPGILETESCHMNRYPCNERSKVRNLENRSKSPKH